MSQQDDFGFIADDEPVDFGFVADEPAADPIIHSDPARDGRPGYSDPDPAPQGRAARHLTLPEVSYQVDPRGRRPDIVTEGTSGTLEIAEDAPAPPAPPVAAQPPAPAVERTDWQRFMSDVGTQGPQAAVGRAVMRMDPESYAGGIPAGVYSDWEGERAGALALPAAPLARLLRWATPEPVREAVRSSGLRDRARGAVEALPGGAGLPEYVRGEGDIGDVYRSGRDEVQAAQRARQERAPISFGAGRVTGELPLMAAPGGQSTVLGRVGAQAGLGLVTGGLRGAGQSTDEDVGGVLLDAGQEAGQEALLSGAFAGGGEVASNALGRLRPWLAGAGERMRLPAARQRLAAGGISAAADTRLIDDPIRAAEVMRETGISRGLSSAREAGERGQQVRRQANSVITGLENQAREASEAARNASGYRGGPVPGAVPREQVVSQLQQLRDGIHGQAANNTAARSRLDQMISGYETNYPDGNVPIDAVMADWRAFRNSRNFLTGQPLDALAESQQDLRRLFRGDMEQAMEQAAGPGARQQLAQSLERVHVGRTAQNGAERLGQRGGGNRVLSPTDYLTAAGGLSGAGYAMAGGVDTPTALMMAGGAVIANRLIRNREHAVAATALEGLSSALSSLGTPQAARWAQQLQAAQARGPQALAALHYALQRRDPAYREAAEAAQQEE
jgi:hypothetical protein